MAKTSNVKKSQDSKLSDDSTKDKTEETDFILEATMSYYMFLLSGLFIVYAFVFERLFGFNQYDSATYAIALLAISHSIFGFLLMEQLSV